MQMVVQAEGSRNLGKILLTSAHLPKTQANQNSNNGVASMQLPVAALDQQGSCCINSRLASKTVGDQKHKWIRVINGVSENAD